MMRRLAVAALMLAWVAPLQAQTIRGTVVDISNQRGVAGAAVYLMDGAGEHLAGAMTDSVGRYQLDVAEAGEFKLVVQRFGYIDMETPLLSASEPRVYPLDLEVQPEPVGIGGLTVTVRNEQVIDWLSLEMGVNPVATFGFRLIQGDRLAEARLNAGGDPTNTLRELYIPVTHGARCVGINSVPRAVRGGWRGPRTGVTAEPGSVPAGTRSAGDAPAGAPGGGCGTLMVNDRAIPAEHIDEIDMSEIAVITTLPGSVRMYTYNFDWSFRRR